MANIFAGQCLPNGRPVTFNAILAGTVLGGPKALDTYLEARIAQVSRRAATLPPGAERTLALDALVAFEAARKLLPRLEMHQMEVRLAAAARTAGRAAAGARP